MSSTSATKAGAQRNSSSPLLPTDSPNFAIGDCLQASDSAEELRGLIAALHGEFQQLRLAKFSVESRAARLADEAGTRRRETERRLAALMQENAGLKSAVGDAEGQLDRAWRTAQRLEEENGRLIGEQAGRRAARDAVVAQTAAAERRAAAAERDCTEIESALKVLTKNASKKERLRRSTTSPF
jgi:DNA repair exonuclease SbcCD ATPase subunit